jgi:hypothetical protein
MIDNGWPKDALWTRTIVLVLAVLFAAFLLLPSKVWALDSFDIQGVHVDVVAENAAAARRKALKDGERTAFYSLLKRLTLRSDWQRFPDMSSDEIAFYVNDMSVGEEKTSAVRYLAALNFRFKSKEIRNFLNDFALPFAETKSKPVLVLPVYQSAGALILWDEPNPWREAWKNRDAIYGLVPTKLPEGDLQDIATIGAEQAVDGDAQRLGAIAARHNGIDTIVAYGILRMDAAGALPELEVFASRYGSDVQGQTLVKTFPSGQEESIDELLKRAAEDLTWSIEDNWKRDNLLQFDRPGVIALTVRIGSLRDWLAVRQRLDDVAVIRQIDVVLMSRDEVRVNLHYIGDREQLALTLEQANLSIIKDGDEWILSLS